ncbi:MAG: ATP phosphoribosyltransferase regulatory subunit [Deltaproteobacteria bacterium]|nr:ATP phosphoribosyltransferase regulatory subunit [Candidatus Zymogenaceae bacterium]
MHDTRRGADLLPTDMLRFRYTERVFREEAIRWGYQEVRTPTIEPLSLFTAAGTLDPGMLEDLYSFLDWDGWSGERVVLRPDGTIPIGRLFIERLAGHERARLFHISNTFAYDEDGTSEHWQCGAEYLDAAGGDRAHADTEVASMALSVLTKLGFEAPHLRVGYPPLIRAVLGTMELSASRRREVTEYIRTRNIQGLKGLSDIEGMKKLLGLLELSSSSADLIKNITAYLPNTDETSRALEDFSSSLAALEAAHIPFEITFALPLVFEYYTGLVMEIYPDKERTKRKDLLISGGRYDGLIDLLSDGETRARAVGFALRVDRLIECPDFIRALSRRGVLVMPGDDLNLARACVCHLRDAGFIAEVAGIAQDHSNFRWHVTFENGTLHVTDTDSGTITHHPTERLSDVPSSLT